MRGTAQHSAAGTTGQCGRAVEGQRDLLINSDDAVANAGRCFHAQGNFVGWVGSVPLHERRMAGLGAAVCGFGWSRQK